MSCSLDQNPFLFPASTVGSDILNNICVMTNITSNAAAQSLMATCCQSKTLTTIIDGCYTYCNVTGTAAQDSWTSCIKKDPSSANLDYDCTINGENNPLGSDGSSASWVQVPASSGTIYLGGSSGTIVTFPTGSGTAASGASATTTGAGSQATGNATASGSSAAPKVTSSAKPSGSATGTSSGASASATKSSAVPTVKQFSKGAVAILALAFVGLLA